VETEAKAKTRGRPRKVGTVPKIGLEKTIKGQTKKDITRRYFARRNLLQIPDEILDANPDKHFCFLSLPRLQKNGMWHPDGYELLKVEDLPSDMQDKYAAAPDNFLHRGEMVLGYISKEEHEQRKMEEAVVMGRRDLNDIIKNDGNLSGCNPDSKSDERKMDVHEFLGKEENNG